MIEVARTISITDAADHTVQISIPEARMDKLNVAFVYAKPVASDHSWTFTHELGRQYVAEKQSDVYTVYVDNVPETEEAEMVLHALAEEGFEVIFTTSLGFMESTAAAAAAFSDTNFIHIAGPKKAEPNFGNLFGAMEEMKYLAGMVGCRRARCSFRFISSGDCGIISRSRGSASCQRCCKRHAAYLP